MKKLNLIIFCLIIFTSFSPAQVYQQWLKTYNYPETFSYDQAYCVTTDHTGNIFVSGCTGSTSFYLLTLMYSPQGEQVWMASLPIGSYQQIENSLAVDSLGYLYVICATGDVRERYATIKYAGLKGYIVWTRYFDNPASNGNYPNDIVIDKSNNVIVTGYGGTVKYNSSGQELWHSFISPMKSVAVDINSNVYVTGGDLNFKTVKYNSNGVVQWEFNFGGRGNSICLDDSSNVYVRGFNNIGFSIAKLSSGGMYKWFINYAPQNVEFIIAPALRIDKSRNVIIGGTAVSPGGIGDYFVTKFNSSGSLLWDKRYNGTVNNDDRGQALEIDSMNNIYITGSSIGEYNTQEIATIKYNPSGGLEWIKRYIDWPLSIGMGIALKNFDVFITGSEVGPGTNNLDYITIKYSQVIGIEPISNQIPNSYTLYQNYPNPFNPTTKIRFDIPPSLNGEGGEGVRLIIYDLLGREVATLVNEELKPGTYEVEWPAPSEDGSNYSSGVYFYSLITDNFKETKKMILSK